MTNLKLDKLIDNPATKVIVCCGSGGVGKTTTSAALALRAAERGRKTVVLTIDPARRLAQSLGLKELGNTPKKVAVQGFEPAGELSAMMLDMRRTFDDMVKEIHHLIEQMTDDERRSYFAESLFLNTVRYENDKLEAYMNKLSRK